MPPKKCTKKIRDASSPNKRRTCGVAFTGDLCPNRESHVLPIKTGFCSNGWCEGKKAKDWRDRPVPTCKFTITCPCNCHDELDELFFLTNSERQVVDASGYQRPERTYWLPSDEPITVLSRPDHATVVQIIESPIPDRVPARVAATFTPTATGRAARGELESWVQEQVDIWLVEQDAELCTPQYLSEEIGRAKGIMPPSVGAIGSVFDRWAALGFAVTARKPVRFISYTPEGIRVGLEGMKLKAKQAKKMKSLEVRRRVG